MTGQEARDDEREALAERVRRVRAWQQFEAEDFLASDMEAVITLAESALRKHPEPEITDEMVERAAERMHMRATGFEGRKSWSDTTDRIRQGWRDALEAALLVPVEEGEQ